MKSDREIDSLIKKNQPGEGQDFIQRMIGRGSSLGLGLRIRQRGAAWVFVFTLAERKGVMHLGEYPELSRADAEIKAIRLRQQVNSGADPRLIAKIEADRPLVMSGTSGTTLIELVDAWLARRKEHTRNTIRRRFEIHLFDAAGALPVDSIQAGHWLTLLDAVHHGTAKKRPAPSAAIKLLLDLRSAFAFARALRLATSRELDDITPSLLGLRPVSRERVLNDDELRDVLRWTIGGKAPAYYRNIVRLIILFGCRTREVRLSRPEEWDLSAGVWTVPAEHSKNDIEIVRPITDAARPLVADLLHRNAATGWLLGKEVTQSTASKYVSRIHERLGHSVKWAAHDLRRTMRTRLADLDVLPFVGEALIGHTVPGIEGVYNRSTMLGQKLAALDKWHKEIARIERAGIINVLNKAENQ